MGIWGSFQYQLRVLCGADKMIRPTEDNGNICIFEFLGPPGTIENVPPKFFVWCRQNYLTHRFKKCKHLHYIPLA